MTTTRLQIIENGHIARPLLRDFAIDPDKFDDDTVEAIWEHLDECEDCTENYDRMQELGEDPECPQEKTEARAPEAATERVTFDLDDLKRKTIADREAEREGKETAVEPEETPENEASEGSVAVEEIPDLEDLPDLEEPPDLEGPPGPEELPDLEEWSDLEETPDPEELPDLEEPYDLEETPDPEELPDLEESPPVEKSTAIVEVPSEKTTPDESSQSISGEESEEPAQEVEVESRPDTIPETAPAEVSSETASVEAPVPPPEQASVPSAPAATPSRKKARGPANNVLGKILGFIKSPKSAIVFAAVILAAAAATLLLRLDRPTKPSNPVEGWAPFDVIETKIPLQEIPVRKLVRGRIPEAKGADVDLDFHGIKQLVIAVDLDFLSRKDLVYDLTVRGVDNVAVFSEQIPDRYIKEGRVFLRLVPKQFNDGQVYTLELVSHQNEGSELKVAECVFNVSK